MYKNNSCTKRINHVFWVTRGSFSSVEAWLKSTKVCTLHAKYRNLYYQFMCVINISFLLIKDGIKTRYSPLPSFLFCSNVTRVTSDSFVPSLRYVRKCTPKYRCRPATPDAPFSIWEEKMLLLLPSPQLRLQLRYADDTRTFSNPFSSVSNCPPFGPP